MDIFILIGNFVYLPPRRRIPYAAFNLLCIAALFVLFRIPEWPGMLVTVFTIDLFMAIEYLAQAKRISPCGKAAIALTKLIGDLFAWMANLNSSLFVMLVGAIVLLFNLIYFYYCLDERKQLLK